MPEFIALPEVLDWMDSGEPFSIAFVTCDQRKGKGGEWLEIEKAYKHNWLPKAEQRKLKGLQPSSNLVKRHPRHYENSTRNISIAANGDIRKVHIRLIRKFNGKTVL